MIRPSVPKGCRDFSDLEIEKRQYIIRIIKSHFESFCYQPIETPAFENLSTLSGSYGEEGERLIFKILNSGDFISKIPREAFENSISLAPKISEKALRYDLTVPFSRYVAMHQNELTFPFKRYQIQPVWRADRPQKGRYREFYQCDADVIGSNSLWQEVELLEIYGRVFSELKLPVCVKINHRKILTGIVNALGIQNQLPDFIVALDKLDKIGLEALVSELTKKEIPESAINQIRPLLELEGDNNEKLRYIEKLLSPYPEGNQGVQELKQLMERWSKLGLSRDFLEFDLSLARGLHYYTGAIFEVRTQEGSTSSIGGGGRYDKLSESFGLKNMSGVGISFGLDRIYLALESLSLFPDKISTTQGVLFLNFGEEEALESMKLIKVLQLKNIKSQLYPDAIKPSKQMNYADKNKYPWVVFLGSEELKNRQLIVKNMKTGKQSLCLFEDLVDFIKNESPNS